MRVGCEMWVRCEMRVRCGEWRQFEPSSSRRAMTWAWISAAPSKIDRISASHRMREIGNSIAKPLPPWRRGSLDLTSQVRDEREEIFLYADLHLFNVGTDCNRRSIPKSAM